MLHTGADGLELDYKTDVRHAHDRMKHRAVFLGNLDPSGLLTHATVDQVRRQTAHLLEIFADTPRFILKNLHAMIQTTRHP